MFYREAGDFSTSYPEDSQTFPIRFDRYRYYLVLFVAIFVIPFTINDYWVNSIFLPFLIYCDRCNRSEHSGWLLWTGFFGHRWFHGCWGICLLQADDGLSRS